MDNSCDCNPNTKPAINVIFRNSSGTVNSKGKPAQPYPIELQISGEDSERYKFTIPVDGSLEISASKSLQMDIVRLPPPTESVGTMTDFTEYPNLTLAQLRQRLDPRFESHTLNPTSRRECACLSFLGSRKI